MPSIGFLAPKPMPFITARQETPNILHLDLLGKGPRLASPRLYPQQWASEHAASPALPFARRLLQPSSAELAPCTCDVKNSIETTRPFHKVIASAGA